MIREEGRYLDWVHYDMPRFSLLTVYLSCTEKRSIPFMYRKSKQHLWLDLHQSGEEIFESFTANTRNEIRQFRQREPDIVRDSSVEELAELFRPTSRARGLGRNQLKRLRRKPINRICSRLYDEEYGLLAAHLYLPDDKGNTAYLDCNASAFRKREDTPFRQLCGQANRYLFWEDFIHFKGLRFDTIDLGGIAPTEDAPDNLKGVYRFKQSFGGRVRALYDYYPLWYHYLRSIRSSWI